LEDHEGANRSNNELFIINEFFIAALVFGAVIGLVAASRLLKKSLARGIAM
jgi:hypothetical protein